MKFIQTVLTLVTVCAAGAVLAQEEEEERSFGKWRIAVGGAFNGAVRSSVSPRNVYVPARYTLPAGTTTRAEAMSRAQSGQYDGGGYIKADNLNNGWNTENWKLPTSFYRPNAGDPEGHFELENSYQEIVGSSVSRAGTSTSDDPYQFGISAEISREIWAHDEWGDNRWGVDFAAAFSYFFQRDVYHASGEATRTDTVLDGSIQTIVDDPDAMYDYENGTDTPVNNMYGHGNATADFNSPALLWSNVKDPQDVGGTTRTVSSMSGYTASGDYRELEMLFMFRPWYEITDWWRVFAQVGVGVSWGRFESRFNGTGVCTSESFDQWDVYGVAGVGTLFRYDIFSLSFDIFGRFLRDDMDVNGQYVHGSVSRADWGFRVMAGVEF